MAISKSPDMPMESSRKSMRGFSRARVSRSERKLPEADPRGLRIFVKRSNGHQTAHGEVLKGGEPFEQETQLPAVGFDTRFGWLRAKFQFEQDRHSFAQLAGRIVQPLREP